MTVAKELGEVIREARIKSGQSQEKLALNSGLNRSYIPKIERGDRMPTVDTVKMLSDALGIKLSVLMKRLERKLEK